MTVLLEEEAYGFESNLSLQQTKSNFGFSDGYVAIYCEDIDFLKDRKVTHVCFSPHFSNIVATCYDRFVFAADLYEFHNYYEIYQCRLVL